MNKKLKKGLTTTMAAAMGLGVVIPAVPVIAAPATNGWVLTAQGWTFYKSGVKATGWVLDGGKWYLLDSYGVMKTGWAKDAGTWYFLTASGAMATGWLKDTDGKWYFFNNSGAMTANAWISGKYYVGADGAMLAGTVTPDGWTVDANGAWDGHSKTADLAAATAAVTKAETTKSQADIDAAKALVAKLTVTADVTGLTARLNAVSANFEVSSVAAVNANEIKVVFSKAVDSVTAENTANYALTVNNSTAALSSATLQADGVTVVLKLAAPMASGNSYTVDVTGVVAAANYATVNAYTDTAKLFYDATAPQLLSAGYDGTNVVLTYNEPVTTSGAVAIKVDGTTYNTGLTASTDTGVYTLSVPVALANGSHSVTAYYVQDLDANVANVATTTFTTTADTTVPAVTSITQKDYKSLKVAFSTKLSTLGTGNFTFTKGGYVIPSSEYTVSPDLADDSTGKTYKVDFSGAVADLVNPLYGTNETAETLNVTVKNFQGLNSYYGNPYVGNVVLSKTTTAPYVLASNLNTVTGNTVKVKFNTDLASATSSYITVKDANNIILPVTGAVVDGTDDQYVDITFTGTATSLLNVTLQAGAVADALGNTNVDTTTTATNTATTASIQPVVTYTADTINIAYGQAMDASAAVASSYTLDGLALPTGTSIGFYQNNQNVQIILPGGYVPATSSSLLTISTAVKNSTGTTNVAATGTTTTPFTQLVTLADNVKPTLTAANYVLSPSTATTTSSITLTFSENMQASADVDDFAFYVNGALVTPQSISFTGNQATVNFGSTVITVGQTMTVSSVATSSQNDATTGAKDVAGNTLTSGTTVTVTK